MLLGHRKAVEEDQDKNWCVVLNALENEIDRKRVSQKISEIFSLSTEEASDLVRSTPIILLDHLSKSMADRLKGYFATFGANLILSKDTVFKRKCYRTVWPQAPSLSFLHSWNDGLPSKELIQDTTSHEAMNPEQALDEIRAMMHERIRKKEMSGIPSKMEIPLPGFAPSQKEIVPAAKEPQPAENVASVETHPTAQEKQPVDSSLNKDAAAPVIQPEAVSSNEQELKKSLEEMEQKYQKIRSDYDQVQKQFRGEISLAQQEGELLKKKLEEVLAQFQQGEEERKRLIRFAQEKELTYQQISQDQQGFKEQMHKDQSSMTSGLEDLRRAFSEINKRLDYLESEKIRVEKQLIDQAGQINAFERKVESIEGRLGSLATREEFKEHVDSEMEKSMAQARESFMDSARKAISEVAATVPQSESKPEPSGLDEKITGLCVWAEKQQDVLEKILKFLLIRETQEATAVEKPAVQAPEQQKSWNRSEHEKQLAARLTDKEALLKRLVSEQEEVEKAIHEREDQIRRILADQEKIEKEIIEVRQAQRQFSLFDRAK